MFILKHWYVYLPLFLVHAMKDTTGIQNCSSHTDCTDNKFCCTTSFGTLRKVCLENCVDKLCKWKKDCGSDEECCTYSNKCTFWKADCDCRLNNVCKEMNLYCCKQRYWSEKSICSTNCTEQSCHANEDCAPEECCSRTYRCTKDKYTCLEVCNTNSDCFNNIRPYCCGNRYKTRYCSNTCLHWQCRSDSDCGEPQQCCIDQFCTNTNCMSTIDSLKLVIGLASGVVFAIIFTVIIIICYRKRMGGHAFLQPRTPVETIELTADPQLSRDPLLNLPPPPYSVDSQPFPESQNEEFPPVYNLQEVHRNV